MRDGWVETKLGKFIFINTGKLDVSAASEFGKYPFFTCSRETYQIDEAAFDGESVLVAGNGDLNVKYYDGKFNAYQRTYVLNSIDKNILDNKFLFIYMQMYIEYLRSETRGTVIQYLKKGQFTDAIINLPPISEQKRIVDLISSVDSYFEALQLQLENTKNSRNAVLNELLTAGGDEWAETTLGSICDFINGDRGKNYPSAKFRQSHGIPFINAGHLENGVVNFEEMDFISDEVFKRLGSGKIQPGDTLFCLRGSVGKFANVENLEKGAIASSLVIIRPGSQITKDFLLHYLDSDLCLSELKQSLTGAVQPNLSANSLKSFKISLPNVETQIEIGKLLSQFSLSITKLSRTIESTKFLRSGLLSDLLSGEHEIPSSYDKVIGAA
jgi:type I restriction enzyme S subunit